MQSTIHKGTNVISQRQWIKLFLKMNYVKICCDRRSYYQSIIIDDESYPSNFKAKNINCKTLTAQNNSSSKDRSCRTLQIHIAIEMILTKTKGTKTCKKSNEYNQYNLYEYAFKIIQFERSKYYSPVSISVWVDLNDSFPRIAYCRRLVARTSKEGGVLQGY